MSPEAMDRGRDWIASRKRPPPLIHTRIRKVAASVRGNAQAHRLHADAPSCFNGVNVGAATCGPRGSPFQSPTELADGLGLGSDLGSGCPAPCAPSPVFTGDSGSPASAHRKAGGLRLQCFERIHLGHRTRRMSTLPPGPLQTVATPGHAPTAPLPGAFSIGASVGSLSDRSTASARPVSPAARCPIALRKASNRKSPSPVPRSTRSRNAAISISLHRASMKYRSSTC